MYTSNHAKIRFLERVNCNGLPKKSKQRKKYIENYLKDAYKNGLTPEKVQDKYLRDYMYGKLVKDKHDISVTKITYYKNNIFLFHYNTCVTILDMPEKAKNVIDSLVYINNIKTFIKSLNESKKVKDWLYEYGESITQDKALNRVLIKYDNLTYSKIINNLPLQCIKYIKNDSNLKSTLIKANRHRNKDIKLKYYYICALLLMFPKNQILELQNIYKNNKNSFFAIISNNRITKRHLDICYKQLYILYGEIKPKYSHFKTSDNVCFDLINDFICDIIDIYVDEIKILFKDYNERKQ